MCPECMTSLFVLMEIPWEAYITRWPKYEQNNFFQYVLGSRAAEGRAREPREEGEAAQVRPISGGQGTQEGAQQAQGSRAAEVHAGQSGPVRPLPAAGQEQGDQGGGVVKK